MSMNMLTKEAPEPILEKMLEILKRVAPRHIDEFGFYHDGELLLIVNPGIETYLPYGTREEDMKWLKKSFLCVKKREVHVSRINRVRALSEEVRLDEPWEQE